MTDQILTRNAIGKQDVNHRDGILETFTRRTSTGGALTLNKIGPAIDVAHVYGSDTTTGNAIQNAVTAIGSVNKDCLVLEHGTWTIDANVTVPANLGVFVCPGAVLKPASGVTATINNLAYAPDMQWIDTSDGGSVVFGSKGQVDPQWFGAKTSNTAAANSTAFQAAVDSITTSGGTFYLPTGSWPFNTFNLPDSINLIGEISDSSIFDCRGAGIIGTGKWYFQRIGNFTVTHANATGGPYYLIDGRLGAKHCVFSDLIVIGQNGVSTGGLVIRGVNPATSLANAWTWMNRFENILMKSDGGGEVAGNGLYLYGQAISNGRCNDNQIVGGQYEGWSTSIYIKGNGNLIINTSLSPVSVAGVHIDNSQSTSIDCQNNMFLHAYFDSTWSTGPKVLVTNGCATQTTFVRSWGKSLHAADITKAGAQTAYISAQVMSDNLTLGAETDVDAFADTGNWIDYYHDNGIFGMLGGQSILSGRFLLSGPDFVTAKNVVGKRGSAAAVVQKIDGSSFRVNHTVDGINFNKLLDLDGMDGAITSLKRSLSKDASAVDASEDTLTIATHGLVTSQRVSYSTTTTVIGGLAQGATYYVIAVDANTVRLAATAAYALAGTYIDLTDTGAGTHTLITGGPLGTFTMPAATNFIVLNPAAAASSLVQLFAENAPAATLMGGASSLYIYANGAGYFQVATADAGSAAGTEQFNYILLN